MIWEEWMLRKKLRQLEGFTLDWSLGSMQDESEGSGRVWSSLAKNRRSAPAQSQFVKVRRGFLSLLFLFTTTTTTAPLPPSSSFSSSYPICPSNLVSSRWFLAFKDVCQNTSWTQAKWTESFRDHVWQTYRLSKHNLEKSLNKLYNI